PWLFVRSTSARRLTIDRHCSRLNVFIMAYELPKLPYDYNALEPHIDARTMEIHYTKHHQAYITNVNNAIKGKADLEKKSAEDLIRDLKSVPEDIRTVVRNNGGGHANHSFFWKIMGPKAGGDPKGKLADDIKSTFGGLDQFKEKFPAAGVGRSATAWRGLLKRKLSQASGRLSFSGDRPPGSRVLRKGSEHSRAFDSLRHRRRHRAVAGGGHQSDQTRR